MEPVAPPPLLTVFMLGTVSMQICSGYDLTKLEFVAHDQEWLLRANTITYRTLGGSFDFYFLSGQDDDDSSSALTTISQFHMGWLVRLLSTTLHC